MLQWPWASGLGESDAFLFSANQFPSSPQSVFSGHLQSIALETRARFVTAFAPDVDNRFRRGIISNAVRPLESAVALRAPCRTSRFRKSLSVFFAALTD